MALAFIPSISSSSSPPRFYTSPSPSSPSLHFYGSVGSNISNSTTLSVKSSNLAAPESSRSSLDPGELYESCKTWRWRGHSINFLAKGNGPPLLLVHGFGASIGHWRRNIGVLADGYTVYAIDLLGFGASDKPEGFSYTMETWAQLILDFLDEVIQKPTVLVGNSVGSLACVIAASEPASRLVKGLVLLNCAGGMNNKAIVDDWRIKLLLPLLWLFDFLLRQRVIASALFERVKQRENLKNILLSVYGNKEAVDDDLVEIIKKPADDEGALDAFVSVVTGPPGPNPISLMPKISLPVLVLWGDQDPFTPIDGPYCFICGAGSDAEMEALEVTKSLIASDSFGGAVDWPEAKSLQLVRHCMTPSVQLQRLKNSSNVKSLHLRCIPESICYCMADSSKLFETNNLMGTVPSDITICSN